MSSLINQILEILDIEHVDQSKLGDLEYQELDSWDSLALITLIGFIEQRTGRLLSASELSELTTIRELENFILDGGGNDLRENR